VDKEVKIGHARTLEGHHIFAIDGLIQPNPYIQCHLLNSSEV